jgi:regulator of protease activity HflC (stomatin/prohibitin superfamily)
VIGVAIIWKPFLYVTEPGNATVVFNLFTGIQAGRVEQPGVSWITPGVDSPVTYNTRTRIWQFTDTPNAPNLASNAISVNTSDGQAFVVDVYVALKPNLEVLDVLHSKIGPRYMETIVVPLVRSKVRDVSAGFDSEAYFAKADRAMMEQQMLDLITQEMPQATVNGSSVPLITIEEVFLGTPRFPQALKDSLEQKQVASITAQTAGVRAQIQEKETMRRLILAEANQTAIELQGQAAAGNAQLADLLFYERLEDRISAAKSQGQTSPLKVIRVEGEDATIFLNVDPQRAAAAQ